MSDFPDYVLKNRAHWDKQAPDWVEAGERNWADEPSWGIWGIPETELHLLPEDMTGMHAIELGCGTGYVSAWMIRRGARCVGIDNSEQQLETARRLAEKYVVDLKLIHGNAEVVPYPDESFDFAMSEYGVAIWADPYKWVPEAWRVLRCGGELSLLGTHPFVMTAQHYDTDAPATRNLVYPYFDMHRIDWDDGEDSGTDFNLTISNWMRLFRDVGFEIVDYHELRSPTAGDDTRFYVTADWAHDYPAEQAWRLRKRA